MILRQFVNSPPHFLLVFVRQLQKNFQVRISACSSWFKQTKILQVKRKEMVKQFHLPSVLRAGSTEVTEGKPPLAIPVSRMWGSTATTQSWWSSHVFLATSSLIICGAQNTRGVGRPCDTEPAGPLEQRLGIVMLILEEQSNSKS